MTLKALLLILDYDTYCKIYISDKLYTFDNVRNLLNYEKILLSQQIIGVRHHTSFLIIKLSGSFRRGIENEKD